MQNVTSTTMEFRVTGSATVPSRTSQPRVSQAAEEFEAQMMKELLKPMTCDSLSGGGDGEDGAGSAGALGEFACEALGKALSAQGGFGIARQIAAALSHPGAGFGTGHETDRCPQDNTKSRSQ